MNLRLGAPNKGNLLQTPVSNFAFRKLDTGILHKITTHCMQFGLGCWFYHIWQLFNKKCQLKMEIQLG